MTKAELDKKSLAELHGLAAEAGIDRFRMLARGELVAKLADDAGSAEPSPPSGDGEPRERPPRRRRRRSGGGGDAGAREDSGSRGDSGGRERAARAPRESRARPERAPERTPEPELPPRAEPQSAPPSGSAEPRPRRRRRRRFGRRGKQGVTVHSLLVPAANRQALLAAESREACTALLRGVAAELAGESKGPDPVALLIDPSPEELADWRREAPQAEIVAAGQPRHASDALAQAIARASGGDDVILLVDSLTRLADAYGDADAAKEFFDAGQTATGSGTLTVVAALERPSSS